MCAHASKPASPAQPPEASAGALRTLVALVGTPAAWTLQTLVSYAMSAYACYPEHRPLHAPLWDGMLIKLEWAVMLICIGLGIAAASVAWRWWRQVWLLDGRNRSVAKNTRKDAGGDAEKDPEARTRARAGARTQDAPRGRVRFLAMSGMMVSCVFLVALLFTASATLMMPPCGPWRT